MRSKTLKTKSQVNIYFWGHLGGSVSYASAFGSGVPKLWFILKGQVDLTFRIIYVCISLKSSPLLKTHQINRYKDKNCKIHTSDDLKRKKIYNQSWYFKKNTLWRQSWGQMQSPWGQSLFCFQVSGTEHVLGTFLLNWIQLQFSCFKPFSLWVIHSCIWQKFIENLLRGRHHVRHWVYNDKRELPA